MDAWPSSLAMERGVQPSVIVALGSAPRSSKQGVSGGGKCKAYLQHWAPTNLGMALGVALLPSRQPHDDPAPDSSPLIGAIG
jgi:hypothetical protein